MSHDSFIAVFRETVARGLSDLEGSGFADTIEILRPLPTHELATLFEDLLNDPEASLALGVVRAIGLARCSDAVQLVIRLADEPGKWFSHADREAIRMASVEALGLLQDESAVDVLANLIRSGGDSELLLEAILALARIGSPASVDPLITQMRANPLLSLSAAGALAQIGGEEAFQGLVCGLSHEDEMIRSACVWALGEMGDERGVGPLVALSERCDAFLRRDIAWALGRIGGLKARLTLGALCQIDPDVAVRREASRAIKSGAELGKLRETQ